MSSLSSFFPIPEVGVLGGADNPPYQEKPYYDKRGKVRQTLAKNHLIAELEKENFEEIKTIYNQWRNEIEYMVIGEQRNKNLLDSNYTEYRAFAVKCAKRGNDVYIKRRIKQRLEPLMNLDQMVAEKKIYAVFLTLTCDINRYGSKLEAWRDIGKRWNRLVSWIRRKRQDNYYDYNERYIGFFRVFESTKKGYPHIHAILFFKNEVWIPKRKLDELWGAFTWIEKCRNVKGTVNYLVKYLEKSFTEESHQLTPSILWMLGLRSFGISQEIFQFIQYLMHNSNTIQINLRNENSNVEYFIFNGIYTIEELMKDAIRSDSLVRFRLGSWFIMLDFHPTERDKKWEMIESFETGH